MYRIVADGHTANEVLAGWALPGLYTADQAAAELDRLAEEGLLGQAIGLHGNRPGWHAELAV
jgi:hypothetical protein